MLDLLRPYTGYIFWCALMGVPFWWLADVLGLWERWQTAIEEKFRALHK